MIELGLARISRLLTDTILPWRAIHVAATNGKGSICAYLSSILSVTGVHNGRFTSPHLIDRWDCITINDRVVSQSLFRLVEDRVKRRNEAHAIGATEFELLTATAFEIFTQERVQVGVVEVGVGGRLDATNVLQNPLVSVIGKIGLDHQSLLGSTLEQIAKEKAGIMKPGTPCVVDGSNLSSVLEAIKSQAKATGVRELLITSGAFYDGIDSQIKGVLDALPMPFQKDNLLTAISAIGFIGRVHGQVNDRGNVVKGIQATKWPGRLESLSIEKLTGRSRSVLIDGAHNAQSASVLGDFVNKTLRTGRGPVTWVIGASVGKNLVEMLRCLVLPGDNLVAVEFGPVEGMPWAHAMSGESILEAAQPLLAPLGETSQVGRDIPSGLQWASRVANGGPLVIAGSLYLVSDVLRLLRMQERTSIGSPSG